MTAFCAISLLSYLVNTIFLKYSRSTFHSLFKWLKILSIQFSPSSRKLIFPSFRFHLELNRYGTLNYLFFIQVDIRHYRVYNHRFLHLNKFQYHKQKLFLDVVLLVVFMGYNRIGWNLTYLLLNKFLSHKKLFSNIFNSFN